MKLKSGQGVNSYFEFRSFEHRIFSEWNAEPNPFVHVVHRDLGHELNPPNLKRRVCFCDEIGDYHGRKSRNQAPRKPLEHAAHRRFCDNLSFFLPYFPIKRAETRKARESTFNSYYVNRVYDYSGSSIFGCCSRLAKFCSLGCCAWFLCLSLGLSSLAAKGAEPTAEKSDLPRIPPTEPKNVISTFSIREGSISNWLPLSH